MGIDNFSSDTSPVESPVGNTLNQLGAVGSRAVIELDTPLAEKLSQNYDVYRDRIHPLRQAVAGKTDAEVAQMDGYRTCGNESWLFILDETTVSRLPKNTHGSASIEGYVYPLLEVHGVPCFEQLLAFSEEDIATVSEFIPGNSMDRYSSEDLGEIPDYHWQQLAEAVGVAVEKNITIDGNDGNLLYDYENGFGILDFGTRENTSEQTSDVSQAISSAIFGFSKWNSRPSSYGGPVESEFFEDYLTQREVFSDIIPVYEKWLRILHDSGAKVNNKPMKTEIQTMQKIVDQLGDESEIERLIEVTRTKREATLARLRSRLENITEDDGDLLPSTLQRQIDLASSPKPQLFTNGKKWPSSRQQDR